MMHQDKELQPQEPTATDTSLSLLTFKVARQLYGVPVNNVIRIIEMVTITHLPEAPPSIQGLINLHGKAVPVMDLHLRFGLPQPTYGLHTPIVLVETTETNDISRPLGLVVDSVQDVEEVPLDDIERNEKLVAMTNGKPTPSQQQQASYLCGVAKIDREMILLLNAAALLRPHELALLFAAMEEG